MNFRISIIKTQSRYLLTCHDEASVQRLFDGIDNIILTTIQVSTFFSGL
jgi:hypothetical protein